MSYPDAELIRKHLKTRRLGRNIYCIDETPSTNTLAKELAGRGCADGTLVICREQTKGRGRGERRWHSDSENSICMSIVLRPETDPAVLPRYTPALALACVRAMKQFGISCEIKWPNDILADGRKLCGILSEGAFYGDRYFIVCGIGINANMHFDGGESYSLRRPHDDGYQSAAVSMYDITGEKVQREVFAATLLNEAEIAFSMCGDEADYGVLLTEYAEHSCLTGREVTIYGENVMHGTAQGFDTLGRLIVHTGDDDIVLDSGDVSVRLR